MARYRWILRTVDDTAAQRLAQELNLTVTTARLLAMRGYTEPDDAYRFLNPSLNDLADPRLLPDIEPAVRRLALALERKEPVLVYGDYDADGVTSTTLWVTTLRTLGVRAEPYVPHRMREGYDLHPNAIPMAQAIGARLVLTCDCGTRAHEAVRAFHEEGLEVVVTDHHEPSDTLPCALAVVNPKRADSQYPFRELSGVGVSFRVAEALLRERKIPHKGFYSKMLDLVALGTIADAQAVSTIFINTTISAAGGVVAAMILTQLLYKKVDITMALNGALAGLVAITAEPLTPTLGWALGIGAVGGVIVVLTVPLLDKLHIDDVVGAIPVHLFAGIWGTMAVPLTNADTSFAIQATGV
ncbi:MAG: DHH family phosphoesterase, partial [Fimbriimonadales bacterium]